MKRMTDDEIVQIVNEHRAGRRIEYMPVGIVGQPWRDVDLDDNGQVIWNFFYFRYRVKLALLAWMCRCCSGLYMAERQGDGLCGACKGRPSPAYGTVCPLDLKGCDKVTSPFRDEPATTTAIKMVRYPVVCGPASYYYQRIGESSHCVHEAMSMVGFKYYEWKAGHRGTMPMTLACGICDYVVFEEKS